MAAKTENPDFDDSETLNNDKSENNSDGELSHVNTVPIELPKIEDGVQAYWRTFVLLLSELDTQVFLDELSPELLTNLLTDPVESAKPPTYTKDGGAPSRESRPDLKLFFYTAPLIQLCHQRMESIHEEFIKRSEDKEVDKVLLSRDFVKDFKSLGGSFSKLQNKTLRAKLGSDTKIEFDAEFLRDVAHLRGLMKPPIQPTYTKKHLAGLPRVSDSSLTINTCLETLQDFADTIPVKNYLIWNQWRKERLLETHKIIVAEADTKNGSGDEEVVLDALRNIAFASGVQFITTDILDRAETEGGTALRLLQTIARRLVKLHISAIPLDQLSRGKCQFCREISLASLVKSKEHETGDSSSPLDCTIGPCVRSLGCNRKSLAEPPDFLCRFGVFLYNNLLVKPRAKQSMWNSGRQDDEVQGTLQFALALSKPVGFGVNAKTLQITGLNGLRGVDIDLDVAALPGSPARQFVRKNKLSPISSPETLGIVQEWIRECDASHKECAAWVASGQDDTGLEHDTDPVLPTRVIDVGTLSEPCVKLVLPNGMKARYVTLSHCWGQRDILCTTDDNMADLMGSIPTDEIPATFNDAFYITRRLGIRYIWIDSLCIIQKNETDWRVEADKMGSIYQSAYITLAATASRDAFEPFIPSDKRWCQKAYDFPCELNNRDQGEFSFIVGHANPETHVKNARLNTRGWVLQERLLSRRILHFARDQIYWECRGKAIAEDGTIFPDHRDKRFLFPLPGLMRKLSNLPVDSAEYKSKDDETFQNVWLAILEFYSTCKFTFERDRMIALQGLSNTLRPYTNRVYVDGNWFLPQSTDFPGSLLWCPDDEHYHKAQKGMPSWSWASYGGGIDLSFHNRGYGVAARLLGIEPVDNTLSGLALKGMIISSTTILSDDHRKRSRKMVPEGVGEDEAAVGNVSFDDASRICESITCLYLFNDNVGYPTYLALAACEPNKVHNDWVVYTRVGIASLPRGMEERFPGVLTSVLVV